MKINIKSGTAHIEDTFLKQFKNIKKVSFPKSLRSLPLGAFYKETSLVKVYFEKEIQLTKIPESCFHGCVSLPSIQIPKSVVSIEKHAFKDTTSIEDIDIPPTVRFVDPHAFDGWGDHQIIYVYDKAHMDLINCHAEVVLLHEEDYIEEEAEDGLFIVSVKGGHVSKEYYYPMHVPIKATSKKEASDVARVLPRVKKDHKDVVLGIRKVSKREFQKQIDINKEDPYYQVRSRREQSKYMDIIHDKLIKDPHYIPTKNKRIPKRK